MDNRFWINETVGSRDGFLRVVGLPMPWLARIIGSVGMSSCVPGSLKSSFTLSSELSKLEDDRLSYRYLLWLRGEIDKAALFLGAHGRSFHFPMAGTILFVVEIC